mmetsp:Transcript_6642/g.13407  ORF Transcript_6642/g.13407 Transcript_6642/m.13407 type:complete len:213 (-) Transcript_6642:2-640(-)
MSFGGEFKVGPFNNGINGACLLAKSTVNALGHINIISGSPPCPVLPLFGINGNGLRRTRCLTQFTGDAPFVPTGITAEGMLPSKAGGKVALLVWVIDGDFGFEGDFTGEPEGTPDFGHEEDFRGAFEDIFPGGRKNIIFLGDAHQTDATQSGGAGASGHEIPGCPAACCGEERHGGHFLSTVMPRRCVMVETEIAATDRLKVADSTCFSNDS